jgi:hypothetical protein
VIIPSTTFFLSTFKHSYNGRKPPWKETKGKQLHSSNLYLESRGGATMGHKEATAPLTFYKHAYVHKQKLEVEKSHE